MPFSDHRNVVLIAPIEPKTACRQCWVHPSGDRSRSDSDLLAANIDALEEAVEERTLFGRLHAVPAFRDGRGVLDQGGDHSCFHPYLFSGGAYLPAVAEEVGEPILDQRFRLACGNALPGVAALRPHPLTRLGLTWAVVLIQSRPGLGSHPAGVFSARPLETSAKRFHGCDSMTNAGEFGCRRATLFIADSPPLIVVPSL